MVNSFPARSINRIMNKTRSDWNKICRSTEEDRQLLNIHTEPSNAIGGLITSSPKKELKGLRLMQDSCLPHIISEGYSTFWGKISLKSTSKSCVHFFSV